MPLVKSQEVKSRDTRFTLGVRPIKHKTGWPGLSASRRPGSVPAPFVELLFSAASVHESAARTLNRRTHETVSSCESPGTFYPCGGAACTGVVNALFFVCIGDDPTR